MPFITAAVAAYGAFAVFQAAVTIGSVIYQYKKNADMKAAQEAAAEARKGYEATKQDTVDNLPVVYGLNKIGSVITDYQTKDNYTYAAPTGYNVSNYVPVSGFLSDANNYFEVTVTGTTGSVLTGDGDVGNDIVNITVIRTVVVFGGVTVKDQTVNTATITLSNGVFLSTSFEEYRSGINMVDEGGFSYYAGTSSRVSDSVYRFGIRRVNNDASMSVFANGLDSSKTGSKNEFLITQNAMAFAGISRVTAVDIDGTSIFDDKFLDSLRINVYNEGGVDNMSVANGFNSSNLFTETTYAACVFKLNRDDPQFSNGIPRLNFYVEGQLVYDIEESSGVYSLSSTKTYSSNPSRCLLDYLTNTAYGRGLALADINLESFYNAKVTCDTVVKTGATKSGKITGGSGTTDVRLFELNHIVDTKNPIRENIGQILESMSQATLIWTGGTYKLNIPNPVEQPSVANGLVDSQHVFDDSDIIKSDVHLSWPNSEDKYNQVTVRFPNSYNDFKDDSVSWPPLGSSVYNLYLTEDNGQEFRTVISPAGVTDPYHALAKAEEMVRFSRSGAVISVTLQRKALLLEPGDFFILQSDSLNVSSSVWRVDSVKINSDLSVKVNAYEFNFAILAWNVNDDIAYKNRIVPQQVVSPPLSVIFDSTANDLGTYSGKISWTAPNDAFVRSYLVEYTTDSLTNAQNGTAIFRTIGTTFGSEMDVPGLQTNPYVFSVRSVNSIGEYSVRALSSVETIQLTTVGSVAVIYADTADETTNTQSYTLGANTFVAYYPYDGDLPTLPVTTGISFALFVGPAGADGNDGDTGADGERGPGWWRYETLTASSTASLTTSEVNNFFATATGLSPTVSDRFIIANNIGEATGYLRNAANNAWIEQADFIDGDLLVQGTVTSTAIATGAVTADKIAAGAVTADKITVTDLSAITANLGTISVNTANIANAAVDTLQIAGRAVTIPTTSVNNNLLQFSTSNTDYEVATVSFTSTGENVLITWSFALEEASNAIGVRMPFKLYRDNTLVYRLEAGFNGLTFSPYIVSTNFFTGSFMDTGNSAGAVTYSVEMSRQAGSNSNTYATNRIITALEVKK
jgi:hypothetical protein